ncbi:hypothetical protein CN937_06140 [Bacillus thuringiensis]|nr:hypothetical protein CN937_06140 [Bacillus thuringiensis]
MLLCRRKSKLEFGFSLIEMIVCLFLLSIFFCSFPAYISLKWKINSQKD